MPQLVQCRGLWWSAGGVDPVKGGRIFVRGGAGARNSRASFPLFLPSFLPQLVPFKAIKKPGYIAGPLLGADPLRVSKHSF